MCKHGHISRNALTSALAEAEGQQPWLPTRKLRERTTPDFIVEP
jgi:hypothetical protein